MHRMTATLVAAFSWLAAGCARDEPPALPVSNPSRPGIHKLDELRGPQVDALDRERTLFILPIGMLEVHGPHLPIGNDTIGVTYEANEAAARLRLSLPDWHIVMMPPIAYGQSGANELGGILVHPGTYAMRQSTLRSLVADLGGQVAQNGFKWVFVTNGHGAPTHNIAINEACDFISETFGVTMLHVTALLRADPAIQATGQQILARHFSADEIASFGLDVHAGVGETAGALALYPALVDPAFRSLPGQAGQSLEELREIAGRTGWQGYLSTPAKATAEYGRDVEEWWIGGFTALILRAVRGEDMFAHPRFPDMIPPPVAELTAKALANEATFEARLEAWLAGRR